MVTYRIKRNNASLTPSHWKTDATGYDYLAPLKITQIEDQTLTIYKEGDSGSPVYVLSHQDPALIWISQVVITKPSRRVAEYEGIKCKTLQKYGCPKDQLRLIEVQTVEEFDRFYKDQSPDPLSYYDLHRFHYVLYYHESGEVHSLTGFNTDEEFETGCQAVANYLK